ncbi:MAG: transaldolase [Bacteroidales bacterium]|nr:transaldolase [Bacteroidales bacterium]MDT8430144.1 transaldolase [Bacteroidales bacterium]
MNTKTKALNEQGVSLWLDNITRKILDDRTLEKYITELSVTGLTSNPTIFDNAISKSEDYDTAISESGQDTDSEKLFFTLAIEDIQRAADLFLPVFERTNGVDGFVSIEVSPLLAYDTESTIKAAKTIFSQVNRPNVFIKIPGTPEGLPAIERVIAEGIPVNVTLLFSADQYEAAANAWLNGVEIRAGKGLNPDVRSVASVFVSRWDKAVAGKVPIGLENKLGLAVAQKTYEAYRQFLQSERVQRLLNIGVSPQRLLWASTGTKDPAVSDVLYIENLVTPFSVNTMPENTLLAYADHGEKGDVLPPACQVTEEVLKQFREEGIDIQDLAATLQEEGAASFTDSWNHLISSIDQKRIQVKHTNNL